ncbi:hypothetical protein HPP92_017580 [Vanilla planifolia]|uniref:Uncharacterized protein n=1 Tax=Vanilla planifolia TaxID=51239 RepID=A0A835QI06_VANPL|nr:hypothetical protein HPP92_017580 [Vanilla planifolia]
MESELSFIHKAKESGVVYLLGHGDIRARKDSWFIKKLMCEGYLEIPTNFPSVLSWSIGLSIGYEDPFRLDHASQFRSFLDGPNLSKEACTLVPVVGSLYVLL